MRKKSRVRDYYREEKRLKLEYEGPHFKIEFKEGNYKHSRPYIKDGVTKVGVFMRIPIRGG